MRLRSSAALAAILASRILQNQSASDWSFSVRKSFSLSVFLNLSFQSHVFHRCITVSQNTWRCAVSSLRFMTRLSVPRMTSERGPDAAPFSTPFSELYWCSSESVKKLLLLTKTFLSCPDVFPLNLSSQVLSFAQISQGLAPPAQPCERVDVPAALFLAAWSSWGSCEWEGGA